MPASARLRVLLGEATAIGPGKADLLDAVARTGSISGAARAMGMSYRRAWLLIDTMNKCFRAPLVETNAGGKGGGGAQVTEFGHEVLARYRAMEEKARTAVGGDLEAFRQLLADDGPDDPA
jgi:molybdate transport system regulatory protein